MANESKSISAPLDKTATGATEPAKKVNRFAAHFGEVSFKMPSASTKTFTENGRSTRKLATLHIEIGNTRTYIEGKVQGVSEGGRKYAEVLFFAAQNRGQAIKTEDGGALADLAEWKRGVLQKFDVWRKQDGNSGVSAAPAAGMEMEDLEF